MIQILNFGISTENIAKFEEYGYEVKRLASAYTVKIGEEVCALIGLSNLLWSNRRADLNIYLSKDIEFDVIKYMMPRIIDKYLQSMQKSNLESIVYNCKASDKVMLYTITNTKMNYICTIPYCIENSNKVESVLMFEYYPEINSKHNIEIKGELSSKESSKTLREVESLINERLKITIEGNLLEDNQEEIVKIEELKDILFEDSNGFRAISPNCLAKELGEMNSVVLGYIDALTNRNQFSISLGEDKYMIQEGNGKYGASKQVLNFDYILVNQDNEFVGCCNRLATQGRNARIDIAIHPKYQNSGLGSKLLSAYYEELLSKGYLSITSYVFDFNEASNKLHTKFAKFIGTRKKSYYSDGKLWNMNIYVKTK